MKFSRSTFWAAWALALWATPLCAADAGTRALDVSIESLDSSGRFPDSAAYCPPGATPTKDINPGIRWSKGPPATRSYALLMTDPDVPADLTLLNKPGVTIASDAPRMTVFHWVIADIPPSVTEIAAGADSQGLVPRGKPVGPTAYGLRGANVFTSFLAGQKDLSGTYGGYDGPCPPANDRRTHHYIVRVMALDVDTLGLSGPFTGPDIEHATAGHVLAEGTATGTYSVPFAISR